MKDAVEIRKSASQSLVKYFDLDLCLEDRKDLEDALAEVSSKLLPLIEHYLQKDISQLLNLLYRIDVSEQRLKEALTNTQPASKICELIIEREFQKAESRIKYRQK